MSMKIKVKLKMNYMIMLNILFRLTPLPLKRVQTRVLTVVLNVMSGGFYKNPFLVMIFQPRHFQTG